MTDIISRVQAQLLSPQNLDLAGIGMYEEYMRVRPSDDLARSLIGGVTADGLDGTSGLEAQLDDLLTGTDGEMVFLRLWTGRTGLMRRVGNRELCYLVDPESVRVSADGGGKSLTIDFPAHKPMSGTYMFRSEKEAAEVGLWLLGSVAVAIPQEFTLPSHA